MGHTGQNRSYRCGERSPLNRGKIRVSFRNCRKIRKDKEKLINIIISLRLPNLRNRKIGNLQHFQDKDANLPPKATFIAFSSTNFSEISTNTQTFSQCLRSHGCITMTFFSKDPSQDGLPPPYTCGKTLMKR